MTWNYRIIRHRDHVALHEVFYDKDGIAKSWTERAVSFVGNDEADLIRSLEMALKDAKNRPVFEPQK